MLNRLAELIRLRPSLDEVIPRVSPAAAADLSQLPVGTDLQARVAAALPNRVYQVVIGDRAYVLPLPIDARPGDEIQLTVVERDTQRAPEPAARPTAGSGGAAVTTLSETARFITTLLNPQTQPPAPLPLAGAVKPSAPLLSGPPADTTAVAARLSHALAASGMFYESHQAQWVAGERSLAQLMQEPQARVSPLPPEPVRADIPGGDIAAAVPAPARAAEAPVHPALLPIVKEQLQTLSALQLAWQGPVWPGQHMQWEIAEEPRRGGADEPAAWRTRLKLKLPRLGDVSATLNIGAAGIGISLAAGTAETADALTAGSAALRSALSKAGLGPASLTIVRAGHP